MSDGGTALTRREAAKIVHCTDNVDLQPRNPFRQGIGTGKNAIGAVPAVEPADDEHPVRIITHTGPRCDRRVTGAEKRLVDAIPHDHRPFRAKTEGVDEEALEIV